MKRRPDRPQTPLNAAASKRLLVPVMGADVVKNLRASRARGARIVDHRLLGLT